MKWDNFDHNTQHDKNAIKSISMQKIFRKSKLFYFVE